MLKSQVMPHQQVPNRPAPRPVSRKLETYRPRRDSFETLRWEVKFERAMLPRKAELTTAMPEPDTTLF